VADDDFEQSDEVADSSQKRSGSGLISIVKAAAFVSVIVVVEIVAASMLAPSAQETERLGEQLAAASTGDAAQSHDDHHDDAEPEHKDELREVELGVYNITRFNPDTNTTLAIDFELYGAVLAEEATEFQHLFENSKARIREQVTMILHGSNSADLTDAGLGLIKRRILEKTNRALGQPLLKEVLFSKFSFVER
jgi:hypothetical protein